MATASSYTQSLSNFIPEIWSKELLAVWQEEFVFKNVINTRYEGEIKRYGDTVHIPTLAAVTVGDYFNTSQGTTMVTYEVLSDSKASLVVDQRKYYAFKLEDLDNSQAPQDVRAQALRDAAKGMMRACEAYVLGSTVIGSGANSSNLLTTATVTTNAIQMVLDATTVPGTYSSSATNSAATLKTRLQPLTGTPTGFIYEVTTGSATVNGTEPVWSTVIGSTNTCGGGAVFTCVGRVGTLSNAAIGKLTASNLYSYLVTARAMLTKQKTWEDGNMVAVIPPEIMGIINLSSELIHATDKADSVIRQGFQGVLAGFKLYESNNVTGSGTDAAPYNCFLGNNKAICYAGGFTEGPEAIRLENEFSTGVRGLQAFGAIVPANNKYAGIRWECSL